MIKTHIPYKILMEWFTKSLLPPISKDPTIVGGTTEEQAIFCVQHLDLIYPQLGTLYDIIPNYPMLSTDPRKPNPGPHADDVVDFVSHTSMNQLVAQMDKMSIKTHSSASSTSAQTILVPTQISKVNSVQYTQPKSP
jgi:hypothetical protein